MCSHFCRGQDNHQVLGNSANHGRKRSGLCMCVWSLRSSREGRRWPPSTPLRKWINPWMRSKSTQIVTNFLKLKDQVARLSSWAASLQQEFHHVEEHGLTWWWVPPRFEGISAIIVGRSPISCCEAAERRFTWLPWCVQGRWFIRA